MRSRAARTFEVLYPLAFVGSFILFLPLLSVVLPLQAAALAPSDRAGTLSRFLLVGAVVASASNVLIGNASDRTFRRKLNRRSWVLAGLPLLTLGYLGFGLAKDTMAVLASLLLLQVSFNMLLAPLGAVLGDHVEDSRRGRVSALMNLAPPAATGVSAVIALPAFSSVGIRLIVIFGLGLGLMAPFLFSKAYRDARGNAPRSQTDSGAGAGARTSSMDDFVFLFVSRLLVQIGFWLTVTYILFFIQDRVDASASASSLSRAQSRFAVLTASSAIAAMSSGLLAGLFSDAIGRRKPFIILSGFAMAGGLLVLAFASRWSVVLSAYLMIQVGHAVFVTIDLAAAMEVLRGTQARGRHLGLLNLTNTLPSIISPVLGLAVLQGPETYRWLFLGAAALVILGALLFLPIKSVR